MPRTKLLVSALALALAGSSVAQAQSFSDVVVFGDSLSDAGNVGFVDGNPATLPGSSFTTNPDSVYAEIVAQAFGYSGTYSLAGGSNYAFGGACARANSGSFTCGLSPGSFSLTTQLGGYLAGHGGAADPNALYMMWGGANDIFTAAGAPATAQQNTGIAAATMVGLIGTLQNAGANTIVVFNLPDLGLTPLNVGTVNAPGASALSFVYNQTFNAGLANLGDGIVPINVFGLINEIVADPSLYGFTDVTHQACGGGSSLACGPTGDANYPFHYAAGTNDTYLFADGVHPTGAAHAMLANVVLSTLSAPGAVSYASEVPLQVYDDHSGTINQQMFRAGVRNDDQPSVYGNVQFSQQDFNANANTSALDNDLFSLTFGADTRFNEHFSFGAAATFGSSSGDAASGASVDNKDFLVSGYGIAHFGRGYAGVVLSGGSAHFDIDRAIELGATTRTETGNTQASHTGAELVAGFSFGDAFRHGPFASMTWQNVDVDGYREDSNDSTSMWFGDFSRKSTVSRFGYRAEGDMGGIRVFGHVAHASDNQDRIASVQAGSNTMNGHFTLDGYPGADSWYEGDLGVGYGINEDTSVSLSYRGRFSDDTQDLSSFNVGFEMKF